MNLHVASASPNNFPYTKHHPLWKRWLTFLLLLPMMIGPLIIFFPLDHLRKEFWEGPAHLFYNSEPRTKNLNLKRVNVTLQQPIDNRARTVDHQKLMHKIQSKMRTDMTYFGAKPNATDKNLFKLMVNQLYFSDKGILRRQYIARAHLDLIAALNDSTMQEPIDNRAGTTDQEFMHKIQSKMQTDMTYFGANQNATDKNLVIKTTVNQFHSSDKGILWKQSIARVNLSMTAALNDSIILAKKYQVKYASGGLDKDYEGSIVITDTDPSIIVNGVALRKTLDKFYSDLCKGMAKAEVTKMNNVLFMVGTTYFERGEEAKLIAVADVMKRDQKMIIELDGYTDNKGDLLKDKRLSLDRTKTVKSYLVHHGVKARRIKTKAFGASGQSAQITAKNRVDLIDE